MTASRIGFGIAFGFVAWLTSAMAQAQVPSYLSKPLPPPPGDARQVIKPISATNVLSNDAPPVASPSSQPSVTLSSPTIGSPSLPPGSVTGPYCGGGLVGDCNSPVGGNGPLTYELVGYNGPSFPVLGGVLNNRLVVGWQVGADARTLFMNTDQTAAWVLTVGYSYLHNNGQGTQVNPINVFVPRLGAAGPDNVRRRIPDGPLSLYVREMHRQSFNFGFGRDWWLNGPAGVGTENCSNWRYGVEVGGQWGVAHVNRYNPFITDSSDPLNPKPFVYSRKTGVFHAVYITNSINYERTFGNTILYAGIRGQWVYNWMNLVAPQDGDLQDANIGMTLGIRF